jgi:hypothetical protein
VDIHPVCRVFRATRPQNCGKFRAQFGGGYFVSVKIEHPSVAALLFAKTLLLAETLPLMIDDFGTNARCNVGGVIPTAVLYNDDLIYPVNHRRNATGNPMGLVFCDDKTRHW